MIEIRPFDRLGAANHGWLDAKHHFSFADYRDHDRMNWGRLRVWNDDTSPSNHAIAVIRIGTNILMISLKFITKL